MSGPAKLNENTKIPRRAPTLDSDFYFAAPGTGAGGVNSIAALLGLVSGVAPIYNFADIDALLANTTIGINFFAYVANAEDEIGRPGYALYQYIGPSRDDISSYTLLARTWSLAEVLGVDNDADGQVIKNIGDAVDDGDAVNLAQLMTAIAGLVQHFRGTYASESALNSAVPTGNEGDYAFVDAGEGSLAELWIWDNDDEEWIQGGSSPTPDATSSIKGVMKLYTSLGLNTDGTLTQQIITNTFYSKADGAFTYVTKTGSYTMATNEADIIDAGGSLVMDSSSGDLTLPNGLIGAGKSFAVRGFANMVNGGTMVITGTNGTLAISPGRTAIVEVLSATTAKLHNGSAVPTWSTSVTGGAIESTQAQAEAVASGAAANSLTGLSQSRGPSEHSLFYFFRKVLTLAWTWAAKQTFTSAPRFSSVTASEVLVVDSNKDLSSVSYSSLRDSIDATDVLNAVAISSGTLTLAWGTATKSDFDLTSTATGNFTIAFTGSNMRRGRLMLRVTGTIVITMPSACVMDLFEKSVGRWDDSSNTLTIIGSTASPFYMTFEKDSAGNIWVHCSNRGV